MTDQKHTARLVVIEPAALAGVVMTFCQPNMLIGREATADFVLDDVYVSRRHTRVTTEASGWVRITDLDSLSGTFVNEERLTGSRALRPGDLVRIADVVTRFEPAYSDSEPVDSARSAEPPTEMIAKVQSGAPATAAPEAAAQQAVGISAKDM